MNTEILEQIGLQKEEVKVYLALLRHDSVTATKIASETNIYRTNVYRLIDSLLSHGLASYVLKNNVKYFSAASPKKILEDYNEKQKELQKLIPELEKISNSQDEDLKVRVFKGKEGLIAVIKNIVRERKNYVVFGEEGKFQEVLPFFVEQLIRDIIHFKMHEKVLSKESQRDKILLTKNSQIKYLPDKYFSPTMTVVFGNYVAIFFWEEPYYATLIKSKPMAQSYKNYFEGLWEIARK
jgi:sugar-specific transcriptional regulator TrmB